MNQHRLNGTKCFLLCHKELGNYNILSMSMEAAIICGFKRMLEIIAFVVASCSKCDRDSFRVLSEMWPRYVFLCQCFTEKIMTALSCLLLILGMRWAGIHDGELVYVVVYGLRCDRNVSDDVLWSEVWRSCLVWCCFTAWGAMSFLRDIVSRSEWGVTRIVLWGGVSSSELR